MIKKIIYRLKTQLNLDKDGDLAKLMGVNQTTFSSWKNRDTIDFNILLDFCKKNNISLDWLFEFETNKTINEPKSETVSEIDEIKNRLKILENAVSKIIKE